MFLSFMNQYDDSVQSHGALALKIKALTAATVIKDVLLIEWGTKNKLRQRIILYFSIVNK